MARTYIYADRENRYSVIMGDIMKKVIIIAIISVVIGVGLWLFIPRHSRMENTIRCYDLNGVDFSLSDDTKLDEAVDFQDVECDLEINHSIVFGTRLYGTVKIDEIEYDVDSRNNSIYNDWTGALLSFNDQTYIYLSSDRNHIMLQDSREEGKVYWVGAEGNMSELKEACRAFGFNYFFE